MNKIETKKNTKNKLNKIWSFAKKKKKKNKIDKPLANLIKVRQKKIQISKIRNKKEEKTTNTKEIQEIIRDYFENLYSIPINLKILKK
jgi:hypothetical protein